MPSQPCLIPEELPDNYSKYPAYVDAVFTMIDECNRRNALINNRNEAILDVRYPASSASQSGGVSASEVSQAATSSVSPARMHNSLTP